MTERQKNSLNRFFVSVFNKILLLEEQCLRSGDCENLSVKELHILEAAAELEKTENNTMTQIAGFLGVTVGSLTTSVGILVKKGRLERRGLPGDRRVVRIFLTESGRKAEQVHRKFHEHMVERVGETMPEEKLETLIGSLDRLTSFFTEMAEKGNLS